MPPAVVVLVLLAIAVPTGAYAALGRPRGLLSALVASLAACALAQAAGEVAGSRLGVLGDAQVLLGTLGAVLATLSVAALEARPRSR